MPDDQPLHNYKRKILGLIAEGKLSLDPGLWHIDVAHDDWCPALTGGTCTCDPDIYQYPDGNPSARRKL